MKTLIRLADQGKLPDPLIRLGIRFLDFQRLSAEAKGGVEKQLERKQRFIDHMRQSPIALETQKANEQHYEIPPSFFNHVLGKHMKYSSGYWPDKVGTLAEAETAALELVGERAKLSDGLRVLELGCGWGAFSLWAAEQFTHSRITAVSNSASQGEYIQAQCRARGIDNLDIVTSDMNQFEPHGQFDRIVSIEMFEHMRNWERLLSRISTWLSPDAYVFVHFFSHKDVVYAYETVGEDDWMARFFFTGGMMPSDDLPLYFQKDLAVERHWCLDGNHYKKTALAWLSNMDANKEVIERVLAEIYGETNASLWYQRWRIFFMACAELWGYRNGQEWLISHYRLKKMGGDTQTLKRNRGDHD